MLENEKIHNLKRRSELLHVKRKVQDYFNDLEHLINMVEEKGDNINPIELQEIKSLIDVSTDSLSSLKDFTVSLDRNVSTALRKLTIILNGHGGMSN